MAENEKLNQIIEEVYEVYMSSRGTNSHHEYEIRLAEVYEDLEQWKSKYNALENQTNVVHLQNELKELHHQRDHLSEQLGTQAIRQRAGGALLQAGGFEQVAHGDDCIIPGAAVEGSGHRA